MPPPSPQERVETIFGHLLEIHEKQLKAGEIDKERERSRWDTLDTEINDTYVKAGICMMPEAEERLRRNKESWKLIAQGTKVFRDHMKFLLTRGAAESPNALYGNLIRTAAEAPAQQQEVFKMDIVRKHPFIGAVVAHLTKAESEGDPPVVRPYGGWFFSTLEHIGNAQAALDTYADRCRKNAKHNPLLVRFIDDLQADIEDFLLSCIHTACNFAMHAQEEDCAVYMPTTSYHATNSEIPRIERELQQILQMKIYQDFPPAGAGVRGNQVHVPTYISVYDVFKLSEVLEEYMHELAAGKVRIEGHTQRTDEHEARIKFTPTEKSFGNFNFRVDYDRRGKIGLDVGSAQLDDALLNARQLGHHSMHHEMVMKYNALLNACSELSKVADPRNLLQHGERHLYTSVMMSNIPRDAQLSLVSAASISAGKHILFPHGDVYTYHIRGRINKREYKENFEQIVRQGKVLFQ